MSREDPRPAALDIAPDKPVTGEALHAELVAAAGRAGMSLNGLAVRIWPNGTTWKLEQLRLARRPQRATVERVRAGISAAEGRGEWPEPVTGPRLGPRDGLSRSPADGAEAQAAIDAKRRLGERAAAERRPGESVADAFRRIAAEIDPEADVGAARALRREAEARDLATPSALIRKATADWPRQCGKVARLAVEMGVGKAEVWRRVIAAGIDALEQGA
jgi:hypothetical protein